MVLIRKHKQCLCVHDDISSDEKNSIYYTTDGSAPTTASALYLSSLTIDANSTIKYFAKDEAGNEGVTYEASFIIDTQSIIAEFDDKIAHQSVVATNQSSNNFAVPSIGVVGANITHFAYKINEGNYSAFVDSNVTIDISGLADGDYNISLLGQGVNESNQTVPSVLSFVVDNTLPDAIILTSYTFYSHEGTTSQILTKPSNAKYIFYSTNGGDPFAENNTTTTISLDLNDTTTLQVATMDEAKNRSSVAMATITKVQRVSDFVLAQDIVNAPLSTSYYTNTVTLSGLDESQSVLLSQSGFDAVEQLIGENNYEAISVDKALVNGDSIRASFSSSSSYATNKTATLTLRGLNDTNGRVKTVSVVTMEDNTTTTTPATTPTTTTTTSGGSSGGGGGGGGGGGATQTQPTQPVAATQTTIAKPSSATLGEGLNAQTTKNADGSEQTQISIATSDGASDLQINTSNDQASTSVALSNSAQEKTNVSSTVQGTRVSVDKKAPLV